MCPDCERLKDNPSLTGRHLVDPNDPGRHAVDMQGNAVCPKCGALWHKPEGKRPWDLVPEIDRPKTKPAAAKVKPKRHHGSREG
jgi:hypothetical protein